MKAGFLQQLHLQLLTNIFASSFLDDSLILHREMGPDIIVFSPFFVFKKNVTTVNIQMSFFHCERQRMHLSKAAFSSLSLLFLAHLQSSLLPLLLANKMSKRWMLTTTTLRGYETLFIFFHVHSARHDVPINRQRGQSERVKGHSVQQQTI